MSNQASKSGPVETPRHSSDIAGKAFTVRELGTAREELMSRANVLQAEADHETASILRKIGRDNELACLYLLALGEELFSIRDCFSETPEMVREVENCIDASITGAIAYRGLAIFHRTHNQL